MSLAPPGEYSWELLLELGPFKSRNQSRLCKELHAMGKNAGHKAQQRQRHSGGDDGEIPLSGDGTVDATFHTKAWHDARIASLQVERVSWEDWKKQKKMDAAAEQAVADKEEELMAEYR